MIGFKLNGVRLRSTRGYHLIACYAGWGITPILVKN